MRRPNVGWQYFYSAGVLLYLLTAESFSGCSGGDEERPPPVGPDIHGSWQGSYYRTDRAEVLTWINAIVDTYGH